MAFRGMWFKMQIKPFNGVQNAITKHVIQNGISGHGSKCELNYSMVFKMPLRSM
jgi:hypothetical protein